MPLADRNPNQMTFLQHLDELRVRLFYCLLAVGLFCLAGWFVQDRVLDILMRPVQASLPSGVRPVYTALAEPFMLAMKVSFFVGLVLAFPVVVLQIWMFVAPGLHPREKRFAIPFLFFGSVFFFLGTWFGYRVVFPYSARFLINFSGDRFTPMLTISKIFSFETRLILAMGLVFELPVLIFLLARMGLVTPGFLWRHLKYAVLIIFIVAAVLTPTPDAVTMTMVAAPMIGLYFLGILVAVLFGRRRPPAGEDENGEA
ncbi:MAG: twin-arginine translocase subunit TatC [Acidobacteriota bacterium]